MCECCGGDCKICGEDMNEPYGKDLLEAYDKISATFNDFTLLMRKKVPYEQWPEHCKIAGVDEKADGKHVNEPSIHSDIISRIEDIGRAKSMLKYILNDPVFEVLSQDHPYWYSPDAKMREKLDAIRHRLSCISDNLCDLMRVLKRENRDA